MAASDTCNVVLTIFTMVIFSCPSVYMSRDSSSSGPMCSTCNPGGASYPRCMSSSSPGRCQAGHYCSIIYKTGVDFSTYLTVGCTSVCYMTSMKPSSQCIQGGKLTNSNTTCYICCSDSDCYKSFQSTASLSGGIIQIQTTTPATTTTASHGSGVLCPFQCQTTDVDRCRTDRVPCAGNEYCNLVFNVGEKQFEGQCIDQSLKHVCKSYNENHHCPFTLETADDFVKAHPGLQGYCYFACLSGNSHMNELLAPSGKTTAITTSLPAITTSLTKPTTPKSTHKTTTTRSAASLTTTGPGITNSTLSNSTITPSTSDFDYLSLLTSCANRLRDNVCAVLRNSKHVCKLREALTLCPETCNICKTLQGMKCQDTAKDDYCATQIKDPDYCRGNNMSLYVCTKSCGRCDEVVKQMVDEVIQRKPLPDFDHPPSTLPTLHCDELLHASCDHVKALCLASNLNSVCPKECQTCS